MTVYDKKVWEMFLEIKSKLPAQFKPNDVVHMIHRERPEVKSNTIRSHMIGCTPNHPSHSHFSLPHDIFFYLQNGRYRLWSAGDRSTANSSQSKQGQETRAPSNEVVLHWHRFSDFIEARGRFARIPCVYVQTDKEMRPIRIGKASKGLQNRYWGGTGYTVSAAMADAGNFVFVAPVEEALCEDIESELIWQERATLRFNNLGKSHPPRKRLLIRDEGDHPVWQRIESLEQA